MDFMSMWVPMFDQMGDFGQICLAYSWMCFNSFYEIKEATIKVMMPSVGYYRREAIKLGHENESNRLVAEVCRDSSRENIYRLRESAGKLGIDIPDLGSFSQHSKKNNKMYDHQFDNYLEHKKQTSKGTKELIIMQDKIQDYKDVNTRIRANY